jgi:hypothetical protein
MSADRNTLTIEDFAAQMATPEATPEVKAFEQLATIEDPTEVSNAISAALTWGWY